MVNDRQKEELRHYAFSCYLAETWDGYTLDQVASILDSGDPNSEISIAEEYETERPEDVLAMINGEYYNLVRLYERVRGLE